jgi:hypothetical protein
MRRTLRPPAAPPTTTTTAGGNPPAGPDPDLICDANTQTVQPHHRFLRLGSGELVVIGTEGLSR